jgi:hypothetical protein
VAAPQKLSASPEPVVGWTLGAEVGGALVGGAEVGGAEVGATDVGGAEAGAVLVASAPPQNAPPDSSVEVGVAALQKLPPPPDSVVGWTVGAEVDGALVGGTDVGGAEVGGAEAGAVLVASAPPQNAPPDSVVGVPVAQKEGPWIPPGVAVGWTGRAGSPSGAPASIHWRSQSICSVGSWAKCPALRTDRTRLLSGSPGTTTGPPMPPAISPA